MKSILIVAVLMMAAPSISQKSQDDLDLPELHKIRKVTLAPSYGCRSKEDFQKGYASTALFISKNSDGPELLFNGACNAPDYLDVNTAGDDMSVIADLGKVRLEDLNTSQAFNVQRVHSPELHSKFTREAEVQFGHTYAVLVDKKRERGLLYFTITGYIPNERLDLRYSVKEYRHATVHRENERHAEKQERNDRAAKCIWDLRRWYSLYDRMATEIVPFAKVVQLVGELKAPNQNLKREGP
jgi:hypothetical protein